MVKLKALFTIIGLIKLTAVSCLFFLSACDNYPQDPQNTLIEVQQQGRLRVGVIEFPPWGYQNDDEADGIEVQLISIFAGTLEIEPEWEFLSEAQAIAKLKNHELDLVIGGLTRNSPRNSEVGFTRPYLETGEGRQNQHVIAVPQGENRFIIMLERFLLAHETDIRRIYLEAYNL